MIFHKKNSLIALLLATSACTQAAAPVDHKGNLSFGRDGGHAPQTISQNTFQAVPADSIAVSDAAPLSRVQSPVLFSSNDLTPPQKTANIEPVRVNPWTSNAKPELKPTQPEKMITKEVTVPAEPKPAQLSAKTPEAMSRKFIWPVDSHKIVSGYGPKGSGKANDGINIAGNEGEPIWAAADGEVVYVGNELAGYGNMVLIKHSGNKTTTYAHLSRPEVSKYDRVKQGDIIGYVGSTGNVKSPQLHFAVREGREPLDPARFLSRSVAGL
jgi:murein DD-endopeptidase MepM/ murein hydrolase activator NlpD